jgi:hypothetical protein
MLLEPRFRGMVKLLPEMDDPKQLCEAVYALLESILQRDDEQSLLTTLSEVVAEIIGRIPFDGPPDQVQRETRRSASACLRVLQAAYEKRAVGRQECKEENQKSKDLEYWLPPHLAHLLARIDYRTPDLPAPQKGYPTVDALCEAAISRRMERVLTFLQRNNPACKRRLPPIFLFSEEFAGKIKNAVSKFIFPVMRQNRQLRVLEGSMDASKLDTDTFWNHVDDSLRNKLSTGWRHAWSNLRLGDDALIDAEKINPQTLALRAMLKPSSPAAYDIPVVGNREIEVFVSLFDVHVDWWEQLTAKWKAIHDFYEQEKDPRIFQQQAREGALRDGLIRLFEELPEEWSDFMVLLCYRVFPRIDIHFVEAFVQNLGWNEAARERRAPYLMRFLKQARNTPGILAAEHEQELAWKAQTKQLHTYLKGFTEDQGAS